MIFGLRWMDKGVKTSNLGRMNYKSKLVKNKWSLLVDKIVRKQTHLKISTHKEKYFVCSRLVSNHYDKPYIVYYN